MSGQNRGMYKDPGTEVDPTVSKSVIGVATVMHHGPDKQKNNEIKESLRATS